MWDTVTSTHAAPARRLKRAHVVKLAFASAGLVIGVGAGVAIRAGHSSPATSVAPVLASDCQVTGNTMIVTLTYGGRNPVRVRSIEVQSASARIQQSYPVNQSVGSDSVTLSFPAVAGSAYGTTCQVVGYR